MKDFLGMVRDTLPIDNPIGTWQYGRNMVSNKKEKTVSNEDGFSFEYLINGTILGVIATNSDIVYFSKNNDGTDEIGVVKTEVDNPIYETKIKSSLFNFQYNCPIEGVFIYNFKGELIVAWADGIKENSNKPYVANLDNLPVELDNNKELVNVNEFTKLLMFPDKQEATYNIDIVEGNPLINEIAGVYITYAYAFDENDVLPFFSISHYTHLTEYFETYFTPTLSFTGLDLNYNKLQIGLVLKLKDNTLKAYKSYLIDFYTANIDIDINSLNNFTEAAIEDIVINSTQFEKINTITKQNNQVSVGNVITKETFNFQKYANLLELIPIKTPTGTGANIPAVYPNDVSLMPDEVYSFYIELQLLDGSYTNAFHIPGRTAINNELANVTPALTAAFGLPTSLQNEKQFRVINEGIIDTRFGYWENEELYPDTNEFNSTIDYNNLVLGGQDLRNTPIRYHRVPSKDSLGYTFGAYGNGDTNTKSEDFNIGIRVVNFDTVIPTEIKNQIQGYRISFVKRNLSNSLVLGNLLMTNRYQTFNGQGAGQINAPQIERFALKYASNSSNNWQRVAIYGKELLINTPSINPHYLKINFFRNISVSSFGYNVLVNSNKRYQELSRIEYAPNNNIAEGTAFREQMPYATLTFNTQSTDWISGADIDNGAFDVTLFSNNKSVYQGFKSSNLAVLNVTKDLSNNVNLYGGDVYLTEARFNIQQVSFDNTTNEYFFLTRVLNSSLYSPYNNVRFRWNNTPATDRFNSIVYFFGEVPTDSIFLTATSELEIDGNTNAIINDLATILTFNFISNSINVFPYRIYRGLKIANENLSISSFRTFLTNSYYEMPNDKGEIIALRGTDKKMYIQLRYALFIATIKDTLNTGVDKTFLGQSDLFEYIPKEVLVDEKGYIGSNSKFACVFIKDMYITINSYTGQIFIISEGINEISAQGNRQWFRENWRINNNIDNPYISYGFLIAYDKDYERLLFIKKDYEFIGDISLTKSDGEFRQLVTNDTYIDFNDETFYKNNSKTLSYNLTKKMWQFEHDYYPNIIFNTHNNLFSLTTILNGTQRSNVYKHNVKGVKGLYYGNKYESYVDVIFNQNLDITKLYQSIHWVTTVINQNNVVEQFKTINKIAIYNDNQCSGIINLNTSEAYPQRTRNNEWFFNDFRDLVISVTNPILDENGEIEQSNINDLKVWFEKSNFISKFIVVRFIIDNIDNDDVFIHQANIKSIISK